MNIEKITKKVNSVDGLELNQEIKEVLTKEPKTKSKEMPEDLIYILGNFEFLKNKENYKNNPENYKRRFLETYKDLQEYIKNMGGTELDDVNEIYSKYQNSMPESFIIRRERPERVARLMNEEDIEINFDQKIVADRGDKYANCAVWPYGPDPVSGIRSAFNEGHTSAGPIVTVVAVKNNPKNATIEKAEGALETVGTLSREAVRIMSGAMKKEDLQFVILRMPKSYIQENMLTEEEKQNQHTYVFRAFDFK